MSAPTLKPPKPRSRLQRFATLHRLAALVTFLFWFDAVGSALELLVALTRSGALFTGPQPVLSPHGPLPIVWVTIARPLLPHSGSVLIQSGLAHGVQASWNGAILGTAHPTAGQALAFTVTLIPVDLLSIGTLYLAMRLARTAARDSLYTVQAARLVLSLGWWLLAGGLVAGLAGAFARLNLLSLLVTWHPDWVHLPASWGPSWPVEWFGLGLIIFARIMRVSAGMRADLEGTV